MAKDYYEKISLVWDFIRGKICTPKVEHLKFEGHVMLNIKDLDTVCEYNNSSANFWSQSHAEQAEQTALEDCHFCTYQTYMTLSLDRVIRHTFVYHSLTTTKIQISFKSEKLLVDKPTDVHMDGRMDKQQSQSVQNTHQAHLYQQSHI